MKLEEGKTYKTYGGWEVRVIWEVQKHLNIHHYYLAIHKPNTGEESGVVSHNSKGKAISIISVNEPPTYDAHHPADIVI